MRDNKIFWILGIALVFFGVIRALPIGRWLAPYINLSSSGWIVILILVILCWVLFYWYLKNRSN